MKKFVTLAAVAAVLSLSAATAQAGGWGGGYNGHNNYSSGLINVSPSVKTGGIHLLNGNGILSNSPILSGNIVKGILNGNKTSVGNGILGGTLLGILGGNQTKVKKGRR